MSEVRVDLGERSYTIYIAPGGLDRLPGLLNVLGAEGPVGLVTDENVGRLYGDRVAALLRGEGLTPVLCVIPAGEYNKRIRVVEALCGRFLRGGLDRNSFVVALGGGIAGDVAGFAAACFMRGVRFAQVPTTIVAQVDSSVGGKTGVNHPLAKNVIGAFHQPEAVLIDPALLRTLPARELKAGLAEVVKHGVIAAPDLFAYVEDNAQSMLDLDPDAFEFPIRRSCEIKAAVVAEDEREQGRRAILNYGHTFGHAFEAVTHYETFLHGEAIAIGMHAAAWMAARLGLVDQGFVDRQKACIERCGLPVNWSDLPVDAVIDAMKRDKKAIGGTLRFILPAGIGKVVQRTDIEADLVAETLARIKRGG